MPLLEGEVAHFEFQNISFYQTRVVARDIVSRSEGVTLCDDGFALSACETRSRAVDRLGTVCLGTGTLHLTSRRLIFTAGAGGIDRRYSE